MKRLGVLGSLFVALFSLAGCGADPRDGEIKNAITLFNNAAANMRAVKQELDKAIETAKKDNKKLTEKDLKAAEDSTKNLRTFGKQLAVGENVPGGNLSVRGLIELYAEGATDAQKKRLAEKYQSQLIDLITNIQKAQQELDAALVSVEPLAEPAAMKHLRKAINDSREEFRVLARPR
jgi:hypothetical protein